VNKLNSVIVTAAVGAVGLAAAAPTLIRLAHAAVPLVVTVGVVAGVLRILWCHTRR